MPEQPETTSFCSAWFSIQWRQSSRTLVVMSDQYTKLVHTIAAPYVHVTAICVWVTHMCIGQGKLPIHTWRCIRVQEGLYTYGMANARMDNNMWHTAIYMAIWVPPDKVAVLL